MKNTAGMKCALCRRAVDEVTIIVNPELRVERGLTRTSAMVAIDPSAPLQVCRKCYTVQEKKYAWKNRTKPRPFVAQLQFGLDLAPQGSLNSGPK